EIVAKYVEQRRGWLDVHCVPATVHRELDLAHLTILAPRRLAISRILPNRPAGKIFESIDPSLRRGFSIDRTCRRCIGWVRARRDLARVVSAASVALSTISWASAARVIELAQPDATVLLSQRAIARELNRGEAHQYQLALGVDECVRVVVEQHGI